MTYPRALQFLPLAAVLLLCAAGGSSAGDEPAAASPAATLQADVTIRSLDMLRVRMEAQLGKAETLRELGRLEDALVAYEQVEKLHRLGQLQIQALVASLRRAQPSFRPRVRRAVPRPADAPPSAARAAIGIGVGGAGGAFRGRGGARALVVRGGGAKASETSVEMALKWLAAHQSPNGGWESAGFDKWCDGKPARQGPDGVGKALYDPGVTGLALCAFLGAGYTNRGKHPFAKVVAKGLRYLKTIQDSEGCFGPRTSQHYVYNHATASLAMIEAYGMTLSPIFKLSAQKALDFIAASRNPYFAWRYGVRPGDNDTSVTGWMVMALKSAKLINESEKKKGKPEPLTIDEEAFAGAKAWLDKMTDPEHGRVGYIQRGGSPARPQEMIDRFPGDKSESMTAVGMLTRIFLGEDPRKSWSIQKGADLLKATPPTWNTDDGSIDMYYWYYGTLAMFQVGGDSWKTWNKNLKTAVVAHQRLDTTYCMYKGSWDPIGPWGQDGGRVYATALMAMCMEVYYRYDRTFGTR